MDDRLDEVDGPWLLPTRSVRRVLDPFRDDVWGLGVTRRADVRKAIIAGATSDVPNSHLHRSRLREQGAEHGYDAARIAYLVIHPSSDPISLDVIGWDGSTLIEDGCHRIGAAIFRGDPYILATYGGWVDAFRRRFRRRLPQCQASILGVPYLAPKPA